MIARLEGKWHLLGVVGVLRAFEATPLVSVSDMDCLLFPLSAQNICPLMGTFLRANNNSANNYVSVLLKIPVSSFREAIL